jgi:hypothetical protein
MIRRGHYSSNNFQDSKKEKLLKENMGYPPRVLFFNAFELGAQIKSKIENQTKKQNKRNYFCCFQIISESKEAIKTK